MSEKRQKTRKKLVKAAMKLAEDTRWRDIGLNDIAVVAGVALSDVRLALRTKNEILAHFTRMIDDDVMASISAEASDADEDTSPRERLFEVMMTRFEVMGPYKKALKNIYRDVRYKPATLAVLSGPAMSSQYWMLHAAGISADSGRGAARVPGLAAIYARVFPVWLNDEDPGQSKTMAALDKRLTRGEEWLHYAENICQQGNRFLCALMPPFVKARRSGEGRTGNGSGITAPPATNDMATDATNGP